MPFISFIVPVYNIRKYLPACVESVVSQPFDEWEIILVDDNSNDGSERLCDQYTATDARITAIHLPKNVGPGLARNEGLLRAIGDYVFFMDGDDTIGTGELHKLCEAIVKCGFPDMMHVGYSEPFGWASSASVIEHSEARESVCSVDDFLRPFLRNRRVGFQVCQFAIKRLMLLESSLAFRTARVSEDNDYALRSLFDSSTVGEYGRVFYHWRTRLSGSLTSAHAMCWDQMIRTAAEILKLACGSSLSGLHREWALRNVYSILVQFAEVAGAVFPAEVGRNGD
jgi:glycosyltransferase involved in cell wall biosynthesis